MRADITGPSHWGTRPGRPIEHGTRGVTVGACLGYHAFQSIKLRYQVNLQDRDN